MRPLSQNQDSFPGYATWPVLRAQQAKLVDAEGSPGWLIRITPPYDSARTVWLAYEFRYSRLTFEGSAIPRKNQAFADTKDAQFGRVWSPMTIYRDPTPGFVP